MKVSCGRRDEMHPSAPVGKVSIFGRKPALTVRQYQLPVSYKSEWNRVIRLWCFIALEAFFNAECKMHNAESRGTPVEVARLFPPRKTDVEVII